MRVLLLGYSERVNVERRRIERAFKKRGHEVNFVLWGELLFSFSKNGVAIKRRGGRDLRYYDYIVPRSPSAPKFGKKTVMRTNRLYRHFLLVVDYINQYHKHILNERVAKKMHFYDKLSQHYILASNGLPVITSLLYTGKTVQPSVYEKFPRPYIVKSVEGSQGRQVFLISEPKKQIPELLIKYGLGQMLIQKYIQINHDYRVVVVGNQVIRAMKRTSPPGEFRSNIHRGGTGEKARVTEEMKSLALRAARAFGAEHAGVDIIKYKGRHYILEVNIFTGFEGFEKATGVNVAEKLVSYIEKKYLWSIMSYTKTKDKLALIDELFVIEKEDFVGRLTKKGFREALRKNSLLVVKKEHNPIAFLLYDYNKKVAHVSRLVILREYIGQRIGRRMLRELIQQTKHEGALKVRATVPANNERRQQSMRRAGFKKIRTVKGRFFKGTVDGYEFEYKIPRAKKLKGAGFTNGKYK